jgi:1-acyl-sn-glycerol-3-phosphate acyltransferase
MRSASTGTRLGLLDLARVGSRLAAIAAVSAVDYVALRGSLLFAPLFGVERVRVRAAFLRFWARSLARVLGIRVRVEGAVPRPPFLLVSNHLGYVDVVVLASLVGGAFVARHDLAGWPFLGGMSRAAGTLFLRRDRKRDLTRVGGEIQGVITRGGGVVLFPEGTSSAGSTVLPFRAGLLAAAAGTETGVTHATLSYAVPGDHGPASEIVCWWGDMAFGGHFLRLLRIPGFDATVRFGDGPLHERDRKILAEALWQAVSKQFRPVSP